MNRRPGELKIEKESECAMCMPEKNCFSFCGHAELTAYNYVFFLNILPLLMFHSVQRHGIAHHKVCEKNWYFQHLQTIFAFEIFALHCVNRVHTTAKA